MKTAADLNRLKPLKFDWVKEDAKKVLDIFNQKKPVCFTRAADAELFILNGRRRNNPHTGKQNISSSFVLKLAESLRDADIIGLPRDYINARHIYDWDLEIIKACKKLNISVDDDPNRIVSTWICYHIPELLSSLVNGKTVLWINYNAHMFAQLLESEKYCTFYGLENIKSLHIDIPDGKGGWIFKNSMNGIVKSVCEKVDTMPDFDIAIIGAGAMANLIAMYIRDVVKKPVADVGAVLSAMRGQRNRGCFKKNGKDEYLVWEKK